MTSTLEPVYVSSRAARSLWQEYRIYPDRIELESWFALRTLVIPADEILEIEIRPAFVFGDLFRGKGLVYSLPLKLDGADIHRHVAIHRKAGFWRYIRFTPDDPDRFVEICRSILKKD